MGGVVGGVRGVVRLEDIEAFEFLVEDGEGLKLLGLVHLRLEPILDLVLLLDNQVLVRVVEVSVKLQQRDHFVAADRADEPG